MSADAPERNIPVLEVAPLYTVTVEAGNGDPEVHFHAGGQGVWVARMITRLGENAVLCGPFAGESGKVIQVLVESEGIGVHAVATEGENGGYIHDRRDGDRSPVVEVGSRELTRHDADNLYDLMLVDALEAGVAVITGDARRGVTDPSFFARMSRDLGANDVATVADVSGDALRAFEGGLTYLKVSKDDLLRDGFLEKDTDDALMDLMEHFASSKAEHVVVSRAEEPALAFTEGGFVLLKPPTFEPADHRGAGDSMTAGLTIGLAQRLGGDDILRLAAAAGALNVTRHGLGTGTGSQIEQLAEHVELQHLEGRRF